MQYLTVYQTTIARAVLDSVLNERGLNFSVEIAQGGGARELAAQIELLLLTLGVHGGTRLLRVAPAGAEDGMERLTELLCQGSAIDSPPLEGSSRAHASSLADQMWSRGPDVVRVGLAEAVFATPAQVPTLVATAGRPLSLLEVHEAQFVDAATFDDLLVPVARQANATVVLYGSPWNGESWFEAAKQRNRALECAGGLRRHFRVPWQDAAAARPAYAPLVEAARARLGEEHPQFQTRYALRPVAAEGPLLTEAQQRLMSGTHPRRDAPVAVIAGPGVEHIASVSVSAPAGTPA